MKENNTSLTEVQDIYGRVYLLGMGAEILIIADDSDLIQKIQERNQQRGITA
jgi:hypothetical protein